tara:strand:+ start:207 stop:362 length:156 start_codon:yes stop_codon:yes gene_type:complete
LGFDAFYMTGLGVTAKHLGTPDLGLLTQTKMEGHLISNAQFMSAFPLELPQ